MTDGGAVGLVARSHHGATLHCGSVGKVASAERAGWQCGGVQGGIGGACRVAVRRAVGGIAVGGEAAIAGSRLAGWLGRTMARPYIVAGWALWTNKGQHFLLSSY